ncbi:hypothetical protein [Salipiger abyssi]|uniref:Uncharacterized protein n=1 Tax=Salipiger abyssi TaxID=1250539 RepID=A0A1P8UWB3_9RHOB|nr:hypothetical protein [Salipiger abyssi]APZ53694.1 hypothetical protein Ga0080574_TMP3360 [Salipiger abyssi]
MLNFSIGLFLGLLIMAPAVSIVLCAASLTRRAEGRETRPIRRRLLIAGAPGR